MGESPPHQPHAPCAEQQFRILKRTCHDPFEDQDLEIS